MPYADPVDREAYDARRNKRRRKGKEPGYLKFKENRREIYLDRKLRQVCIECEAELEDDDGLRCKDCQERHKHTKAIYDRTPRGRRTKAKWQRRYYDKRKAADCCVQCGLARKQWPKRRYLKKPARKPHRRGKPLICPKCRTAANAAAKRYRARKKAGIASLRSQREKRDRAKVRELRGLTYQPLDALLKQPRVMILRGLLAYEWIDPETLFDAIGAPEYVHGDNKERDRFTVRLSWLVRKARHVERREAGHTGGFAHYEYRINQAGRAELARLFRKAA